VVDSIWLKARDFTQFDRWFQELEDFMRVCPAFTSPEIEARVASSMVTALVLRQPQHPNIETWSERVLSLPEDQVGTGVKMKTLLDLINLHTRLGNVEKMELANEMVEQLTRDRDSSTLDQIFAGVVKAQRCVLMGLYEEGLNSVSRCLEISRTTGLYVFVLVFLGLRALIALELNDLELAKRTLEEMATSLHSATIFEKSFYHFLKTRESLICKDHPLTTHHADLALKHVDHVGSPSNMAPTRLLNAQFMHELGKREEADELLADALSIAHQINSKLFEFNAVMIRAQFAFDQGEEASGLTFLREALTIGKEQRYLNSLVDQPSVTAELCVRALEAGIEFDYVQHIIRKRKLIPDTPPLHLENWPWAVRIFTLGRFELTLDGKPFQSSRKAQKKPLEMLKVLTSFGDGQEVTRDQLSDILWPEAEGDKAQRAFDTTLHRLRQLLANDKALILREGRLSLDPRYCWVDSVAFERVLGQADNAAEQEDRDTAIHLLARAINLYRGPFLGGDAEMPWAISYSERLRSKFLRAIQNLGSYLEEANELDKAVTCFERAIEVDDLAEVFYQSLMLCLKQLGRRSDALAVYQRCRKTLAACLDIEPTPETEVIYESLLSE
jgi:DNA-binding SARP family transcriptional activator